MENRRKLQRVRIKRPVYITNFLERNPGKSINLSQAGISIRSKRDLFENSLVDLGISLDPYMDEVKFSGQVRWKKNIDIDEYQYGIQFLNDSDVNLSKILDEITREEVEIFFNSKLPNHIQEELKGHYLYKKAGKKEIMKTIDFGPPFLRIEKIAIFGNENELLSGYSIGCGCVSSKDTEGHYNKTIYLAMCGWLMATSASIHINFLYPNTAPQVVKADGVMPLHPPTEKTGLWQPSERGTKFWVETRILKRKMQLIVAETKITFNILLYGTIRELKLILTNKETIWTAQQFA